jgi:hypothetical protein
MDMDLGQGQARTLEEYSALSVLSASAIEFYQDTLRYLDEATFGAIIGSLLDTYEDDHPEVDIEGLMTSILEVRDFVKSFISKKLGEDKE